MPACREPTEGGDRRVSRVWGAASRVCWWFRGRPWATSGYLLLPGACISGPKACHSQECVRAAYVFVYGCCRTGTVSDQVQLRWDVSFENKCGDHFVAALKVCHYEGNEGTCISPEQVHTQFTHGLVRCERVLSDLNDLKSNPKGFWDQAVQHFKWQVIASKAL